jgi:alcohol dehydrogenase class IV
MLSGDWNYPTAVRAGAGRIAELPEACATLGIERPLLVTDPGIAGLPLLEAVLDACRAGGLEPLVYSQVKGNPTGDNVSGGLKAFEQNDCNGVIAVGGGSALDAAKAIALLAGQGSPLWDFEDIGDNWQRADPAKIAPIVAVPTTAGTGSEVGRASVITDEIEQRKKIIFHPRMLPGQVILDPEMTRGLPAALTAATGMDALSHSLEALCAPSYHPMAEGIAVEGIRLVKHYLPRAVADGDDLEARMQMLVASSMGATAFQKGLGAMHALAHSLGALYDAHHGLLNAILMPYVIEANAAEIDVKLSRAAAYLGLPEATYSSFLNWVIDLRSRIGIPENLGDIGITAEEAGRVGEMAVADSAAAGNPVPLSVRQYAELFREAVG